MQLVGWYETPNSRSTAREKFGGVDLGRGFGEDGDDAVYEDCAADGGGEGAAYGLEDWGSEVS